MSDSIVDDFDARLTSDEHGPVFGNGNYRRDQPVAAPVANHDRHAVLHVGDQRVGSAEVDADDFAQLLSSFSMPANRLVM